MEHVAILKKSWKLIDLILSGQKKIESRWYKHKRVPWNCIKKGEVVYLKESGEPVTARADVEQVLQFSNLNADKVEEILDTYGELLGIQNELPTFLTRFKDKNYCILIFLRNAQRIEPFNVDKSGFGLMSAWLTLEDVSKIRK